MSEKKLEKLALDALEEVAGGTGLDKKDPEPTKKFIIDPKELLDADRPDPGEAPVPSGSATLNPISESMNPVNPIEKPVIGNSKI